MASPDDLKFQGKVYVSYVFFLVLSLCLSALIFILHVCRVWGSRRSPVFKSWSRNPQHLQPRRSSLLWRCQSWSVRRWRQSAREFRCELRNQTGKWGYKKLIISHGISNFLWIFPQLLGGEKQTGGFWTFEYYQSFFNVDTMQVHLFSY